MIPYGSFKKTRIAPTPSGFLHLGNVLSFAVTAALAKRTGASILLRIDDLDRERADKRYVQDIFDTLNYLEIPWDEGPGNITEYEKEYSQLHRLPLYEKALQLLKDSDSLYACDCSRNLLQSEDHDMYHRHCKEKEIPFEKEYTSWRIHTEPTPLAVKTFAGISHQQLPVIMQDFIVKRKEGYAAYQLASLCDDVFFGVDLVVRGEDLWPSTLAQQWLASVLGENSFQDAVFYHHSLLVEDGAKLSKSAGAVSIQYLRANGHKPVDIYTMIANRMGIQEPVSDWQTLAERLLLV